MQSWIQLGTEGECENVCWFCPRSRRGIGRCFQHYRPGLGLGGLAVESSSLVGRGVNHWADRAGHWVKGENGEHGDPYSTRAEDLWIRLAFLKFGGDGGE